MVNLLVLGDLHCALPALRAVRDQVARLGPELHPEAVLATGDFLDVFRASTAHQAREQMLVLEEELSRYGCEIVCVGGNHDRPDLWGVEGCLRSVDALAGQSGHRVGGFRVLGLGGSWRLGMFPYEWEDGPGLTDRLRKRLPARDGSPEILLSHAPPAGAGVGTLFSGEQTGSTTVRDLVLERQPALCICGHVHEAVGWGKLGRTNVLNAGAIAGVAWLGGLAAAQGPADREGMVRSQANFHLLRLDGGAEALALEAIEGHLVQGRWLLRRLRIEQGEIILADRLT